ncbi:hypothetical protein IMZ08_00090 [Bacillus luteolus]|uniref:Uncharacterized protein n=1 Tax=Litchfieldia luteola TaxID=682179 RepID=A0ABR9QD87_9BACI|nr:hypothetical protein [Cytobacillus luteolus]MBE4906454.1 hypothetical protein [Cytobacillus luteolus]MBP1941242.1 hypothetical protein [Cytobacillus luteolus]
MNNVIEAVEFKFKCAKYHYQQSLKVMLELKEENIHIFISEFCGMMESLHSAIEIANACTYKQSPADAIAFRKSLKAIEIAELEYLEQFLKANRKGNVFEFLDEKTIQIIPIPKKTQMGNYEMRNVETYIKEIMECAERVIYEFIHIYSKSTIHFDQSWRILDMNRASILCKECGGVVTSILGHIGNLNEISLKEKAHLLPQRSYVYGHELIQADLLPWGGANEISENEIIVPIETLSFDVKKEGATGCCGPDSSEFNIYCINGHAVGKEAADCWMPHFIRFPLSRVIRNEVL